MVLAIGGLHDQIQAQNPQKYPYKEPAFDNINPKWIYVPQDTSAIGDSVYMFDVNAAGDTTIIYAQKLYDGRRHFYQSYEVLYNNDLFTVHRSFLLEKLSGAYLSRINIDDGSLIWSNYYDQRTEETDEPPMGLYLDRDNNTLMIYGLYSWNRDALYGKFAIRKYDINTGKIVYQYKVPRLDTASPILQTNLIKDSNLMYFDPDQSKFSYTSGYSAHYDYNHFILDTLGHYISRDYRYLNFRRKILYKSPPFSMGKDSLLTIFLQANTYNIYADTFKSFFTFQYLSPRLDSLSAFTFVIDSFKNNSSFRITYQDSVNIIMGISKELKPLLEYEKYTIILDKNANILDTIQIEGIDSSLSSSYSPTLRNVIRMKDGSFLLSITTYDPDQQKNSFHLAKYEIGSPVRWIGTYPIKPSNVEIYPISFIPVSNDFYLVKMRMLQYIFDEKLGKITYLDTDLWCKVKREALDLTGTKDVNTTPEYTVIVYPNPSDNVLSFEFKERQRGTITIYSAIGKLMSVVHFNHQNVQIDTRTLEPGSYTAVIQVNNHIPTSRKFVVFHPD